MLWLPIFASCAFAGPIQAAPPPPVQRTQESAAQKDAATAELAKACDKVVAAKSYAFEATVETERVKRKGGAKEPAPMVFNGQAQHGAAVRLQQGALEAFRLGSHLVYTHDRKSWELLDPAEVAAEGGARQRGGDGAGGGAPPTGPAGAGVGGGALVSGGVAPSGRGPNRSLMRMYSLPLPHELLQKIGEKLTDVQREEKDGTVTYAGPLSKAAAEEISGATQLRRTAAEIGAGNASADVAGTLRIVVGATQMVERVEIDLKISGGQSGEQERRIVLALSGYDATSYEVPKEALARLGK